MVGTLGGALGGAGARAGEGIIWLAFDIGRFSLSLAVFPKRSFQRNSLVPESVCTSTSGVSTSDLPRKLSGFLVFLIFR